MTGPASLTKVQNWGRVQLTYSLVKYLITHLRALETFHCGPSGAEDDDEVTETKIRAFLDEKALDLKKLQTPLYEQFYNSLNAASLTSAVGTDNKENLSNNFNLPPKSPSPSRLPSRRYSAAVDVSYTASTGSQSKRVSNVGGLGNQNRLDAQSPQLGEWKSSFLILSQSQ